MTVVQELEAALAKERELKAKLAAQNAELAELTRKGAAIQAERAALAAARQANPETATYNTREAALEAYNTITDPQAAARFRERHAQILGLPRR